MGFLSWLSKQLSELDLAAEADEPTPVQKEAAFEPGPDVTLFGLLSHHLKGEVAAVIDELDEPDDQAFGSLLLEAFDRNGVEPPAMPEDVLRIQKLLASPYCDVPDLAAAITRDPAIAGRFVGIANSPMYARTDRVRTVDDAVVRIGLRQTSMIVMAIVAKTKLFRAPGYQAQAHELHRHALASAVTGQLLARRAHIVEGHAFMGGLLHDIGRIWMLSIAGDLNRRSRGRQAVSPTLLADLGDRFHAGFSALVVEEWGFEDVLVASVLYHTAPSRVVAGDPLAAVPESARALTATIAAADMIGATILNPDAPVPDALSSACEQLGLTFDAELKSTCQTAFVAFEQQVA